MCSAVLGGGAAGFTVHVLSVADVLQVAARLLSAQVGLLLVRVQPAVHVSAELRAGGDAAGGGVPHLCPGVGVGAGGKPGSGPDGSRGRRRRCYRSPERARRIRIAASSRVAPAFCVHGGAVGLSAGMDCVSYPAGPVDVFRSRLDPLRQT